MILQLRRIVSLAPGESGGCPAFPAFLEILCRDIFRVLVAHTDRFEAEVCEEGYGYGDRDGHNDLSKRSALKRYKESVHTLTAVIVVTLPVPLSCRATRLPFCAASVGSNMATTAMCRGRWSTSSAVSPQRRSL